MVPTLSDNLLIQRVRAGDEQAAAELYDRYARRVFGLVHGSMSTHLKAQVEAEDIVQSVFKSIFRGVNSGSYDAPASGTLWQLLAVIAIHKVRRNARRLSAAKRDGGRTQPLTASDTSRVADRLTSDEFERAIREIIEGLDEFEQAVVTLRVQGYSVEEIADQSNRSRRSVERTLQRIRSRLADELPVET